MAKSDDAQEMALEIEGIIPRESKTGKPYWSIKSGGEFYNTFDESVKDRLKVGALAMVMVTTTESQGKTFHNIVGIAPNLFEDISSQLDTAPRPKTTSPAVAKPVVDPMIDVRKTALTCANALLAAEVITQKSMNEVLRKYERYITHGLESEQKTSSTSEGLPDLEDFVVNG